MSKIIISYNPDDTKAASSRLNDYLASRFGAGIVTLGVETLITSPADADRVLQNADSLVVMIGNKWSELGAYHSPDDLNRAAIASALRLKKTIIPVLVSGAIIPADLPADISGLAGVNTLSFTAQTVTDDANRIAEALSQAAVSVAPPPNRVPFQTEQPTAIGGTPMPTPTPAPTPSTAQTPPAQQPVPAPKPPKPPVEGTAIPMPPDVTRIVRPLFERFGTLPTLLVPSAVLFGIWFFVTSALITSSGFVQGLVSALFMGLALYVYFYLLSMVLPKLQLKTALIAIIGLPVLTFLFLLFDPNFLFTLLYLAGCGGLVAFGYSNRNRFVPGMQEPRLTNDSAITLSFDISGLVSAMWMLVVYSGAGDLGTRNFAALLAGAMFGAAFGYVVYNALKNAQPQVSIPPIPPATPIQ